MQLKTFSAPTTAEAMQLVRNEIGNDAIIVSTHSDTDGEAVRILVSMDETWTDGPAAALCQGNMLSRVSATTLGPDPPCSPAPALSTAPPQLPRLRRADGPLLPPAP